MVGPAVNKTKKSPYQLQIKSSLEKKRQSGINGGSKDNNEKTKITEKDGSSKSLEDTSKTSVSVDQRVENRLTEQSEASSERTKVAQSTAQAMDFSESFPKNGTGEIVKVLNEHMECFKDVRDVKVEPVEPHKEVLRRYNQAQDFSALSDDEFENLLSIFDWSGLHQKTFQKFGVRWTLDGGKYQVVFPVFSPQGVLTSLRVFTGSLSEEGDISVGPTHSYPKKAVDVFGWQILTGAGTSRRLRPQQVVITNREVNAMAVFQETGIPAFVLENASHLPQEACFISHKDVLSTLNLRDEVYAELQQFDKVAGVKVNTLWGSFEINNVRLIKCMLQQFAGRNMTKHIKDFDEVYGEFSRLPMYFMRMFRQFATEKNCHVTLILHPRKVREGEELSTAAIFGSAKVTQEADNVVKNRFDGDLGMIQLNFDKASNSFLLGRQKQSKPKQPESVDESFQYGDIDGDKD
ncbi:PEO1-like protein [Mya arenaria]|uniref:PEO1-like protein n=1 Tax=Mya arenaria TaxID=6604 RepID=A0ABY7DV28_MYAAR|nr:PEO1-like protein [Mya arenaria]